jgi:hypothetical protein
VNKSFLNKKSGLLFLLAGTVVMMVVMAKTGATLKTDATPKGILDLEFAYNAAKTTNVISAWTGIIPADNVLAAIVNTWLDFIFLFFYSLFLNKACRMITAKHSGFLSATGSVLATGALVAGLLDIFENAGMLVSLNGHISNSVSLLTFIFSVAKWTLALASILYILVAGLLLLIKKQALCPSKVP